MTNYVVVNDTVDYGIPKGQLASIVQGESKTLIIDVRDLVGEDFSIQSATTFSGRLVSLTDGSVTNVSGTLSGDANGDLNWALSSGDSGTADQFFFLVQFTLAGSVHKSFPVLWEVVADPAATAIQNSALVGVSSSAAAMLENEYTGLQAATDGQVWTADGAGVGNWEDAASGVSDFISLSDTPGSITADQALFGNAAGNALEQKTASQARSLIEAAEEPDVVNHWLHHQVFS